MPNPDTTRVLAAIAAAGLLALAPCRAQDTQTSSTDAEEADPRIDADTGRDVRVWPPDILFDHVHVKLELTVPDMTVPKFSCTETITLNPIAVPRSSITLDAGKALNITAAQVGGRDARFEHDKKSAKLTVTFPEPIPPGRVFDLRLVFDAEKPGGGGSGLTWSKDDPRTPEFDWMFHAQGQPEHNHLWFVCHDFPNERVTSEVIATVPAPYEAVSNGRLITVKRSPRAAVPDPANPELAGKAEDDGSGKPPPPDPALHPPGTITYHWRQDKPHAYYLITLIVGRFDVVNLGGPGSATPGLAVPVYGPLGAGEALRQTFGNTPDMIRHFSTLFDFPYPWDKYAQIVCRNFAAGAMENTSATTFNSGLARGRRGTADGIIAHELVHQWFGDLVGYKAWRDLWLGEGWATFGEALWAERAEGQDAYQEAIAQDMGTERARSARRTWPRNAPMVSNRYRNADARFTAGDNVYQKGGAILHMLRMRLGEDAFWRGVHIYLQRHAYQQVETEDFRLALEEASGQSLERFFDQWCERPGMPVLELDYAWKPDTQGDGGEISVTVEQVQTINGDNPAFAFQLPVYAKFPEGSGQDGEFVYVLCDTRTATATAHLPVRPKSMSIDPYLTVLARRKVRQSLDAAADQLFRGPTYAARIQAIDTLADHPGLPAAAALATFALEHFAPGSTPVHQREASAALTAAAAMLPQLPGSLARDARALAQRLEPALAAPRLAGR